MDRDTVQTTVPGTNWDQTVEGRTAKSDSRARENLLELELELQQMEHCDADRVRWLFKGSETSLKTRLS